MKTHYVVIIDLTKDQEEFWKQIAEVDKTLNKKSLWQRIKAWFKR